MRNNPATGESLATQLLSADLETACPSCGYLMWIRYSEVVAQTAVTCLCCYTHIWLIDETGSAQNAGDILQQQITQALKGLFQ
jgi:ribosomal protein S27E